MRNAIQYHWGDQGLTVPIYSDDDDDDDHDEDYIYIYMFTPSALNKNI